MTDALIAAHIGLPHEPAGIVLVERIEELAGEFDAIRKRWRTVTRYAVRQIERPEPGARPTDVADTIAGMVPAGAKRATLLVNVTACGSPPIELLKERRLKPIPIVTTQSDAARRGRGSIQVPAKDMLTQLAILMGERRLVPFGDVPNRDELAAQLREFRDKPKQKRPLEPWREEETGELVMAFALAGWWGETRLSSLVRQPPPPRLPVESPRWPTFSEMVNKSRRARLARSAERI